MDADTKFHVVNNIIIRRFTNTSEITRIYVAIPRTRSFYCECKFEYVSVSENMGSFCRKSKQLRYFNILGCLFYQNCESIAVYMLS